MDESLQALQRAAKGGEVDAVVRLVSALLRAGRDLEAYEAALPHRDQALMRQALGPLAEACNRDDATPLRGPVAQRWFHAVDAEYTWVVAPTGIVGWSVVGHRIFQVCLDPETGAVRSEALVDAVPDAWSWAGLLYLHHGIRDGQSSARLVGALPGRLYLSSDVGVTCLAQA